MQKLKKVGHHVGEDYYNLVWFKKGFKIKLWNSSFTQNIFKYY
jgi:hypothetical protein